MRPDPTPPDPSLFPIAPTFTADLDARALDALVEAARPGVRYARSLPDDVDLSPDGDVSRILSAHHARLARRVLEVLAETGREV